MSSREDTPEPGASAASTSQACPQCRHISTACSGSCRHCFCRLCLWDWNLGQAFCPRCRRPTRHPYPQHLALYHELQDRVYRSKRRSQSCAGPGRRRCRRALGWGSHSPRRRRCRRQRRAWEDAPAEGRAPSFEWAIPASSRRVQCRRSGSPQERPRGRGRGRQRCRRWQRRRRRSPGGDRDTQTGSHSHSAGQRRCGSWSAADRHAARPRHRVPSERSETHPWEDWDCSRQRRTGRRRSRGRSPRRGQDCQAGSPGTVPRDHSGNQRRCRSWNADDRHDSPSRRSVIFQWEDWDSSRQQCATRSRTRGRSHRRGQNSQGSVPRNHSPRQRRWRSWNAEQGRAPRSQRDTPGSSRSSQHRCRSWSRARRRDT